jgi:hypothetical protein
MPYSRRRTNHRAAWSRTRLRTEIVVLLTLAPPSSSAPEANPDAADRGRPPGSRRRMSAKQEYGDEEVQ